MSTPDQLKLDSYYYCFDETGERYIDMILSAVAKAGKAFHHTEQWKDECERAPFIGSSPVEWIQNAGNDAASELTRLRRVNALLLEACKRMLRECGHTEDCNSRENEAEDCDCFYGYIQDAIEEAEGEASDG